MRVSSYRATKGEANFGKPISRQVAGGTHVTFEMITKRGNIFYMTRWPQGLPGHADPKNVLRFPHGLIRFGESLEECARRLVSKQLGMRVKSVEILYWDSYVDGHNHWHVEPGCLVEVAGKPKIPEKASEIISFTIDELPVMTFWERAEFMETVRCKLT